MDNKKQKILVFFIGLLTAIFLLEVSLRVISSIYQKGVMPCEKSSTLEQEGHYTILCLGNSFTVGCGAPKGASYPDQLQHLLNERIKGENIKVINGGKINLNSAELLNKLAAKIDCVNPDLIILRTGGPNWWNHYKYNTYLARENKGNTPSKRLTHSLNDFFYRRSRIYRLITLLISNMKSKINPQLLRYREQKEYIEATEWLKYLRDRWALLYYNLHRETLFVDKQKSEGAIKLFKKVIKADPDYPKNYRYLGEIYFFQKNYEEAIKWFIKGVKADPNYRNIEENRNYFYIRNIYASTSNKRVKEVIDNFIREFSGISPSVSENLLFLTNREIWEWAESDIKEIIRIIREKEIKMILQNYPPNMTGRKKSINGILRKIADDFNIPFVDNEKQFLQEMRINNNDFFVSDGHCNAKGYGLMAMNIYNVIIKEKIFKPNE
ncbi:MAG: tetratricopeptide repeat protein [Candidatus Omnitrophica bacterium]|nr:tetratricopeptide repeat protein [Candidatus Omnitrophota bacterium]